MTFTPGDRVRVLPAYGGESPEDRALVGVAGTVTHYAGTYDYGVDLDEGDGFTYFFMNEELEAA